MDEITDVTKIDDQTIEATKTETKATTARYDYGFLKQQLVDIQSQQDVDNAKREAEKSIVSALIVGAEKLGIHFVKSESEISGVAVTSNPVK